MTKENKIIKDLKERNGKLVNQYRDRDIRCVSLERQLEKLQQENLELRIQVSAREEVIDKAIKFIEDDYYSLNTIDINSIAITSNKLLQVRKILNEVK